MRKKISFFLLTSFMLSVSVWGQTEISVCTGDSCPGGGSSSIDLLKQSFQKSSQTIQGVASSAIPAKTSESPASASAEKQPASAVPPATEPAAPVPPKTTLPKTPAPVPVSTTGSTLDMPLAVGGNVQSVQTTVQPAKKLSPAAAKRVEMAKEKREKNSTAVPTEVETAIEKENALLPPSSKTEDAETPKTPEEEAADAELEYAVKLLEESKEKASSGRRILPSASQNRPGKVPAPNKAFNPNAYRPGVTWVASKSNHFDIYTQKRTSGIPSSNMQMTFESAYQTLTRFIPWMISGRVRVFVYQDRASYLRHEPNAIAWSRAVAYPTRGEVVVYDEPNKGQELKESFTHELTHVFTQRFFDSHKTGQLMTPLWLDEGLAVMMEDHAYNGSKGGPWANDFRTLNFRRKSSSTGSSFGASSIFGSSSTSRFPKSGKRRGKPLFFTPFEEFMQEGSLQSADGKGKAQDWYFQAYTMVRFLLNPSGSSSPSNRMQFEQFTRLLSQGEAKRNPSTGFLVKDKNGKTVYEPYSVEKALGKAYRYNTIDNFEDSFWRWADKR